MSKLHKFIAFSTLLLSMSLIGCGGNTTTENKPTNTPTNTNTAQADKPANTTTENKTEDTKKDDTKAEDTKKDDSKAEDTKKDDSKEVASADKIGVPECDEYVQKIEICLKDKVPATSRAMFENSIKQNREAWKTAAASPQGKSVLASTCKTALETAKTSMASFNCAW